MADLTVSEIISSKIDHTAITPDVTRKMIDRLCWQAREYNFHSVCVLPYFLKRVERELYGSNLKICTVVGFPLGAEISEVKSYEAMAAVSAGADEIDVVMNIPAFLDNEIYEVQKEISNIANAVHNKGAIIKVIIETCLLNDEQKVKAAQLAAKAGADFVKTSTGFSKGGATTGDVKLIKERMEDKIKIKASGGIRTAKFALELIKAGADRLGTSSGVKIMEDAKKIDRKMSRK